MGVTFEIVTHLTKMPPLLAKFVNSLNMNPTNGQTDSNNMSATADELFECVWPFYGVGV